MTTLAMNRSAATSSTIRLVRSIAGAALALFCGVTAVHAQGRTALASTSAITASKGFIISPVLTINRYSMTALPMDTATAMNDGGLIVGADDGKGAVYVNGQVRYLDSPQGYTNVIAWAVSDNGIIVGTGMSAGHQRPLIWKTYTGPGKDMGAIARITQPLAVNTQGVVVGYTMTSATESLPRAYRWTESGGTVDIHPTGFDLSTAFDISESGFIAGYTNVGNNQFYSARWYPSGAFGSIARGSASRVLENGTVYGVGLYQVATMWDVSNTPTLIGPSPTTHEVKQISRNNRYVGVSTAGVAWTTRNGSAITNLPVPAGTFGAAIDVNSCGTILGSYGTTPFDLKPVIWTKMTCDTGGVVLAP